ncbi:MAG: ATP-binding cassette domain-containing protein, partial [Acidimicrobiia bacterium]
MSDPLFEIDDLYAGYGASQVLEGVSLSMGVESVTVVGRNGMGKTTLCNTIMGLVKPSSGVITMNGKKV